MYLHTMSIRVVILIFMDRNWLLNREIINKGAVSLNVYGYTFWTSCNGDFDRWSVKTSGHKINLTVHNCILFK